MKKVKRLTAALLAVIFALALSVSAFASSGFDASIKVTRQENVITVEIQDNAVLRERVPTLSIPAEETFAEAMVLFAGTATKVSYNEGKVSFKVGAGGTYFIVDGLTTAETIPATCTQPGSNVYRFNDTEYIEVIPTLDHDFTDPDWETCANCTQPKPFKVAGTTMTLGNDLNINFFVAKSDLKGECNYAVITKNYADGRDDLVKVVSQEEFLQDETYWIIKFNGIAAKEMADNIHVVVYNAEDVAVSEMYTTSVRRYCMMALDYEAAESFKTVAVDMLNYGAAAQTFFGYNLGDLANNQLSEEQKQYASTTAVYDADDYVKGANFAGTILSLESNIILNLYFQNITTDMHAVVSYKDYRGTEVSMTVSGDKFVKYGNYYGVAVDTLVLGDGYEDVTCVIYDQDDTEVGRVTSSVEVAVTQAMNSSLEDPLYEEMIKFVASAKAYLLSK